MFSKKKWATAGFQRLLISFQNGTATFFESDSQLFRADNSLYAGREAHQIICIRQRIRFVKIVDTPGQPTLRVAPSSKTADMEISYCQYFGGITQAGAYVGPKLSPPVKRPAEKEEWAFSHLLVLQSQVGFDDGCTTANPDFVGLGRLEYSFLLLPILWGHHAGWRIRRAKVEPTGKTSRGKRGMGFLSFACASIAGGLR